MEESTYQELNINEIVLDKDNPRIKMYLEMYGDNVTAEGISLALNSSATDGSTSFSSLKESIRVNQGIINPIIVNHTSDGNYIVIEGNTRLQIYRDFAAVDPEGPWNTIRAIVYEGLDAEQIHSIRLQSHLVGPRDWDPYSKAKYLFYLCYEEKLPMNTIISYCGGKKSEILKLIESYRTMKEHYITKAEEMGFDVDIREFSKFAEYQNKQIKDALIFNKYTADDFAKWVINGNVDKAQNVRQIPQVLKEPEAKKEFLKTNLTNAIKKLDTGGNNTVDLSNLGYEEVGNAFLNKIRNISYAETKSLKKRETKDYDDKMTLLMDIYNELDALLDDLNAE
jgi:hypothetical protein